MKKTNIKLFKTITYLISVIGVVGFASGMITRSIDLALLSLVGMITLIISLWVGFIIYGKITHKEIAFFNITSTNSSYKKSRSMNHIEEMNKTSHKYNEDLINNPKFSSLITNVYHNR